MANRRDFLKQMALGGTTLLLPSVLSSCTPSSSSSNQEYDFYVAPDGNDANPGTEEAPFASLDQARLAVRELKKTKQDHIHVGLKGGRYVLDETIVFSLEDSGSENQQITYEAVGGEEPVLTSETEVGGWTKVEELSDEFPSQAENNIWSAPLPENAGRIKYLFKGKDVLPRSMTKGFVPPVKYNTWTGSKPEDRINMKVPGDIISDWKGVKDMELVIMPTCDWELYHRPLESYDSTTQMVKSAYEGKFALGAQKKSIWGDTPTAWFANCPEGMREEGNWYVNTREQKIYLFSSSRPEDINVPTLVEYIRVDGKGNTDSNEGVPVENIHFKGLVFTNGKRYTWDREEKEPRWELGFYSTALLRLRNTRNCSIMHSSFENSGGAAVRLDLISQNNRIEGNHMKRLGGKALSILGYGDSTTTSFGNEVIGNHVHHVCEAYWGNSAIDLNETSGSRVAHNQIHHTPSNGLRLGGSSASENIVEYNELYRLVETTGDGNAIYVITGGKGNIVRHNYIHDLTHSHASSAMRTDGVGTAQNVAFIGNIVHYITRGGLALKGRGHKAINNIFIDCNQFGESWEGSRGWIDIRCGTSEGMEITNNIFYAAADEDPYFMHANTKESMPQRFKDAELWIDFDKIEQDGNICDSTTLSENEMQATVENIRERGFQLDHENITALSVEDDTVTLNAEDELFEEGYEYIDMSTIGLPEEFPQQWRDYNQEIPMNKHFEHAS